MLAPYGKDTDAYERITSAMARPALFDSFLHYLAGAGYDIPSAHLSRDVSTQWTESEDVQRVLVQVYADDGGPSTVADLLVDLDEGMQEWRYRHVKMVERTIGGKSGTGGSAGAAYLRSTLFHAVFPDLWAVRSHL
jgi:tryptophan 2,3-dioxygenase